jgi:ABC-type oligopeptide transport system substrate-binding subunit
MGKPFDEEEWEVSQDGNTYTYTQRDATSPKPARIILHRMDTH